MQNSTTPSSFVVLIICIRLFSVLLAGRGDREPRGSSAEYVLCDGALLRRARRGVGRDAATAAAAARSADRLARVQPPRDRGLARLADCDESESSPLSTDDCGVIVAGGGGKTRVGGIWDTVAKITSVAAVQTQFRNYIVLELQEISQVTSQIHWWTKTRARRRFKDILWFE